MANVMPPALRVDEAAAGAFGRAGLLPPSALRGVAVVGAFLSLLWLRRRLADEAAEVLELGRDCTDRPFVERADAPARPSSGELKSESEASDSDGRGTLRRAFGRDCGAETTRALTSLVFLAAAVLGEARVLETLACALTGARLLRAVARAGIGEPDTSHQRPTPLEARARTGLPLRCAAALLASGSETSSSSTSSSARFAD